MPRIDGPFRPRKVRPGYWFARRRCGFGGTPATWQGWLAIAIFLCLLLLAVNFLPGKTAQGAAAFALIAVFATISWIKTDGGWRLGDDD